MRVKDIYPIHLFILLFLRGRTVRLDIPTNFTTFIYRHVLLVSAKGARKEYSVLVLLIDMRRRERGRAGWTVRTARARGVTNLRSGWMGLIGSGERRSGEMFRMFRPCDLMMSIYCWLSHIRGNDMDTRQLHVVFNQRRTNQSGI
jgi:hypothetical protein